MKFHVLFISLLVVPLISFAIPVSRMQAKTEQQRERFIQEHNQNRERESSSSAKNTNKDETPTIPPDVLTGTPLTQIPEALASPRYWTTKTGNRVLAKFKNFDRGWVVLENKSHQVFGVHLDKLSDTDCQLLISNWSSSWQYRESIDDISDQLISQATVISINQVNFGFPYDGGSRLVLSLRKHPRLGNAVSIGISNGQFDDQSVMVRFDDNPAFQVSCSEPSDHSSNLLFLGNHSRLVSELQRAHSMKIEVQFYGEGNRVFSFDVSGLIWTN